MKYQYPLFLTFKITTLSSDFTVTDARDKSLFYVRQKMFKLLEEVVVCKDSTQAQKLYTIKANKWLDFSAAYNFTNTAGQELGKIARKGWASIFKAHYEIFDAQQALDDALRHETDESHTKPHKHPDRTILAGLRLPGKMPDDEDHVGDKATDANLK